MSMAPVSGASDSPNNPGLDGPLEVAAHLQNSNKRAASHGPDEEVSQTKRRRPQQITPMDDSTGSTGENGEPGNSNNNLSSGSVSSQSTPPGPRPPYSLAELPQNAADIIEGGSLNIESGDECPLPSTKAHQNVPETPASKSQPGERASHQRRRILPKVRTIFSVNRPGLVKGWVPEGGAFMNMSLEGLRDELHLKKPLEGFCLVLQEVPRSTFEFEFGIGDEAYFRAIKAIFHQRVREARRRHAGLKELIIFELSVSPLREGQDEDEVEYVGDDEIYF